MKKFNKLFLSLVLVLALFISTKAYASGSISAPSNVYTGDAFTIKLSSRAASWEYHVTASGAGVSCSIDQANVSDDLSEVSNTWTTSCTPTSSGRVTITLKGNWTDANGNTKDVSQTIYVTVDNRPVVQTTTQATTQRTTKQTTTTQAPVVQPTEPEQGGVKGEEEIVTTEIAQNPITNIKVVGYDLDFDKNKTEYTINVSKNVTALYIIVEGDNLESVSPGEVDIKDKDVVEVTIPYNDTKYTYTIKLNRTSDGDVETLKNNIRGLTVTLISLGIIMCITSSLFVMYVFSKNKQKI